MNAQPHPLAPELRAVSGRDLAALMASLLLVVAPHAEHSPWWVAMLVLSLYAWRVYLGITRAPAAAALAAARAHRRGDGGNLGPVPHDIRPLAGNRPAVPVLWAQAAGDAQPPRRDGRGVPVLFPDRHQFLLLAEHPDRARDVRRAGRHHHHAGRLRRAAEAVAGEPSHRRTAARARRARCACSVPAFSARARPAVGRAAGRLRGSERALGHDVAWQPGAPRPVGRDRVPGRVPGRAAAAATALLARTRAVGFRRPRLAHGSDDPVQVHAARRRRSDLSLQRRSRAAQPELALRA